MTTIKLFGGDFGSDSMLVRCDLRDASNPVEVDYDTGEGWQGTQYQCAGTRHTLNGLVEIGKTLAASALEMPEVNCQWVEVSEITDDMIRELCILTTRDEAGRHFTEWSKYYEELEELGLVKISRPVHGATGIAYGCDEWSIEFTDEGLAIVENHPELYPNVFNGSNYSIERNDDDQYVLIHPVSENEVFDTFQELVEAHPICEEARSHFE